MALGWFENFPQLFWSFGMRVVWNWFHVNFIVRCMSVVRQLAFVERLGCQIFTVTGVIIQLVGRCVRGWGSGVSSVVGFVGFEETEV